MSSKSSTRRLLAASLFFPVGLLGCASGDYSEHLAGEVRSDPTPELDTLYQRKSDVDNAVAVTVDENWRMFNQDLGRFFLLDRPSILTPEPVPR